MRVPCEFADRLLVFLFQFSRVPVSGYPDCFGGQVV